MKSNVKILILVMGVSGLLVSSVVGLSAARATTSARDCSLEAEQYVGVGYSQPGVFREVLADGNLNYEVRTNDQGGDAAYEIIVTPNCDLVSRRLLWSE